MASTVAETLIDTFRFSSDALGEAARIVHQEVGPTPQIAWPLLERRTGARSSSSTKTIFRPARSRFAAASFSSTP